MLVVWKKHSIYVTSWAHIGSILGNCYIIKTFKYLCMAQVHIVLCQVLPTGKKTALQLHSSTSSYKQAIDEYFQEKKIS